MTWAKLDDGFLDHPKARAAGKDGRALFVASLVFAAQQLTDGFVALDALPLIAAKAEVRPNITAQRLVRIGLWETGDGGWWIHDWKDFNPTAEQVIAIREKRAESGRIGGRRSKPPGSKRLSKTEANASGFAEATSEAKPEANQKQNGTPYPYQMIKREQQQVLEAQQQLMDRNQERLKAEAEAWTPPTDEERARARSAAAEAKAKIRADGGKSDLEEEPW